MYKKLVVLVLLIMLIGTVNAAKAYYTLSITSSSQSPSIAYPGDEINFSIDIKNVGLGSAAENVIVILNLSDNFETENNTISLGEIATKSTETAVFKFMINAETQSGTYNVSVNLEYDIGTVHVTDFQDLSIIISDYYKLDIERFALSTEKPHIGEELEIIAYIRNLSSKTARKVSVEFSKSDSGNFDDFILLSDTAQQIGNMGPGELRRATFIIKPGKDTEPKVYSFDFNVSCIGCPKTVEKTSFMVYGKPNIIVSGIDFSVEGKDEKKIIQGDTFSISIQMDNIGEESAKAVEINITTDEKITGAKKAYVGNIDEDDSGAAIFDLVAMADISTGELPVSINISYINEFGERESITEQFSLYMNAAPPPDLIAPLILFIIAIAALYFFVKMVFRQLAMRKV